MDAREAYERAIRLYDNGAISARALNDARQHYYDTKEPDPGPQVPELPETEPEPPQPLYYRKGRGPKSALARLRGGEKVQAWTHHHAAMAELMAENGNPRPPGRTPGGQPKFVQSLIRPGSPHCYEGYKIRKGEREPVILSTDPGDYAWETHSQARMRIPASVRRAVALSGHSSEPYVRQLGPYKQEKNQPEEREKPVKWESPDDRTPYDRTPQGCFEDKARELRDHPGEWGVIREYEAGRTRQAAYAFAQRIRDGRTKGFRPQGDGRFESSARLQPDGTYRVFARYTEGNDSGR